MKRFEPSRPPLFHERTPGGDVQKTTPEPRAAGALIVASAVVVLMGLGLWVRSSIAPPSPEVYEAPASALPHMQTERSGEQALTPP
jgi:hypothetical protein